MAYCEYCGEREYGGACTNCHESVYIAQQHEELGTYGECSENFKDQVECDQRDIERRQLIRDSI
jgi:hypothetical protein